uniref:lys-63-specific deubiquitinase BRCC36-like n=1 Tax=Styela clava TaxID=7725 RepID=UPI00193AB16A|nr:lys-63-specific deubiquitinase BRCC36-like [Styela clava]
MGSVRMVILNADAYYSCLTHAFSNEQEEIMGLCIGETKDTILGCEVHITSTLSLRRLDKRKDRVEISVEQLSNASSKAEELARKTGRPLRIIGWYHSHPHITVWPSHVDIATQADYQTMDGTFVGLIFSCFNEGKSNEHSIHLTCFQSVTTSGWDSAPHERVEIPISIAPCRTISDACMDALKELPKILMHEETDTYEAANSSDGDFMTRLYNGSVHVQALCKLNSNLLLPMLKVTERSTARAQLKLEETEKDIEELKKRITELKLELGET